MYIDKLGEIVNKYNNTYHRTIKMKPVHIKSNTYINSSKEINNKDPKFEIGDIVRTSKCKIIYGKSYVPNWSEEVFVIKKVKSTLPLLVILKAKKLLELFTKNNCKKETKNSLELKK